VTRARSYRPIWLLLACSRPETEAAMAARIEAAQTALAALRRAEAERKARGLLARLRAAVRGE